MTAVNEQRARAIPLTARLRVSAGLHETSTWRRRYCSLLVMLDLLAVVSAVGLAQQLRFGGQPRSHYVDISLVIAACWMAALSINQSRSPSVIGCGPEEYRRVWSGTFGVFGAVAIVSMLFKLEIARGYLAIALPLGVLLLTSLRWAARRVLVAVRRNHGRCITRVLAVGSAPAVRELTESLAREPSAGYQVAGACIAGPVSGSGLDVPGVGTIPIFGDESSVVTAVHSSCSRAVAVAATERLNGRGIRELSWELEKLDIDMLVAPGVVDVAGPRLEMWPVAGLPLIHVEKPQYKGAKRFQKRLFDVAFSAAVLLCGMPLLMTIALAIKLTSKGPVFYRQQRIGLDGRPFMMFKFRTMVDGADSLLGQLTQFNDSAGRVLFKIHDDPRVTPLGRFLRKYSLDELPQFINVLNRDMSVVGPRPPLASEVDAYEEHVRRRLLVRPGITGLWQISGRSDLSWEDTVRLDLFYVENWSMASDLLIAVKTARAVFCHTGAY